MIFLYRYCQFTWLCQKDGGRSPMGRGSSTRGARKNKGQAAKREREMRRRRGELGDPGDHTSRWGGVTTYYRSSQPVRHTTHSSW